MASLSDTILGTSPGVTTSQNPLLTPQQQAALGSVIGELMQGGTTSTGAYRPYQGQFTAPLSGLQSASLSALEQKTMNEVTGAPGSTTATMQALDALIKSGGSPVNINDYFTKSVEEPMLYDFQNKVLPMLQSSFAGSSAFGSDKLKQQRLLTNDLTKNLTSSRANMAYQSQSDALNRMLTAAGIMPQLTNAFTTGQTAAMSAGAVPQQTQQAQLTAQYQDFLRGQTAAQNQVQQLMAALGMSTFQPSTAVTPGSKGLVSGATDILTALLMQGAKGGNNPLGGLSSIISSPLSFLTDIFGGGSSPVDFLSSLPGIGDIFGGSTGLSDLLPISGASDILGSVFSFL